LPNVGIIYKTPPPSPQVISLKLTKHIATMTLSISNDFKFLLKVLNIIVSLILRDVNMTSQSDQIKLE